MTTNKDLSTPANGSVLWDSPLNLNFEIIDDAFGATSSINVAGVSTTPVALTTSQIQSASLSFTGLLGNNVTYRVPSGVGGSWVIKNSTTGAYTLTIGCAGGGSSVVVPQGYYRVVFCNGTDVFFSETIGSSNQIIYNDGSGLTGSSSLTFNGSKLAAPLISVGDGTKTTPAIESQTDTGTGLFFPGTDAIALAMNGALKTTFNQYGGLGIGDTPAYGTSGQSLVTGGNSAAPSWDWKGLNFLSSVTASSGTTISVSGLSLTPYKFLIAVGKDFKHTAGSNRSFVFDGDTITALVGSGSSMQFVVIVDLTSGVGGFLSGVRDGGSPLAGATLTTLSTASTSYALTLSGSGQFAGGTVRTYGFN